MNQESTRIDQEKLNEFVTKAVGDMGSSFGAIMVILGQKLGLYKSLYEYGPSTSVELANKTKTSERYVREWLASQAAAGYITYDKIEKKFSISNENASVLADENSPAYIMGGYQILRSIFNDIDKFIEIYRTGRGLRWGEHHHDLYEGTAKFFKPNYLSNLIQSWIPSLQGVEDKLVKGAKVADIGCGHGISTAIMAKAFPNSQFYGFDSHPLSIEAAVNNSNKENVKDNVTFSVASADESIGKDFDLITFFDCLHDMGDPLRALKFARKALKENGSCMIVEPMANDNLEDNLNLVGKIYYSASAVLCVPNALADSAEALGAQAGEKRIKELVKEAGFIQFRKATQTPLNVIYEAKT